jgi:hypothetical protein
LSDKTETNEQRVVLPRAEWKAFTEEVRNLIREDEQLLTAYNRLLNAYDQLSQTYNQTSKKETPGKQPSRGRGLFGRKQAPEPKRSCPYCGSSLDPKDKSCPACGRAIDSIPEQKD